MEFPQVTVLICTYNREKEIGEVIASLKEQLIYPASKLKWVACDDSSPDGYAAKIRKANKGLRVVSTEQNSGWAANVNNGLGAVDTDYIFFTEDDYVLTRPLDLRVGVALMETKPDVGMVRYRGTAGSHIVHHQFESDISAIVPDHRDGVGLPGKLTYLQLDSGSPDVYIYSHGPHLKHKRFHDFYGLYPTGLKLGETEESYAHQVKDRMKLGGAPAITILPEFVPMFFEHIGQSYQHTELDK